MASLKFDLPQLDYTTRFSLWQVNMRAILAQTSDLDDALDCFGKKPVGYSTEEEKQKIVRLYLWFNFIYPIIFCRKCCKRNLHWPYG
jgi:hypothetical protein